MFGDLVWFCFVGVLFVVLFLPLFLQLFYQVKGDMCLKIIENGKQKDVVIQEGEVKQICFSVLVLHRYVKQIFCKVFIQQFIPGGQTWHQDSEKKNLEYSIENSVE